MANVFYENEKCESMFMNYIKKNQLKLKANKCYKNYYKFSELNCQFFMLITIPIFNCVNFNIIISC